MPDTYYLVGQTAAGKTAAAIALAERCGGEIVSADAFQVYAGLDLITAKPTSAERARVPHHLIGFVPLADAYNVARFLDDARACIAAIHGRGKRAIVVGGSGLYIKALTHGLSPLPSANAELRAELEALSIGELLARLRVLDPAAAAVIDARNQRRLVRAVEVCLVTGEPFSAGREVWLRDDVDVQGRFLFRDREDLNTRIASRVDAMFAAGVLEDVRAIPPSAIGPTAERIIGLADIRLHLAGKLTLAACQDRIKAATRQYAKRQMTWFKRETFFDPLNLSQTDLPLS